jgi:hypothetical protein
MSNITDRTMTDSDYDQLLQQWEIMCAEVEDVRLAMVEALGKMSRNTPPEIMDEFRAALDEWKRMRAKLDELRKRL